MFSGDEHVGSEVCRDAESSEQSAFLFSAPVRGPRLAANQRTSYQSLPRTSLPLGVKAAHHVDALTPGEILRTLPSPIAAMIPPECEVLGRLPLVW
jgi:hypothetical protein